MMEHQKLMQGESALSQQQGVEQPSQVNPNIVPRRRIGQTKPVKSPEEYLQGIRQGDRSLLSQAITLIESTLPEH